MRAQDHTGKRYGRLVGICFTGRSGAHGRIWVFRCDCGNETEIGGSLAKKGHTKSCGCLEAENPQRALMDRTGTKNGRLTFTHFVGKNSSGANMWAADCDCGNKIETSTPFASKSCGCLRRDRAKSRAQDHKGKRQGRLVFTKPAGRNQHNQIEWFADCDCGNKGRTIPGRGAQSCGCLRGSKTAERMRVIAMTPEEKLQANRRAYRKYRGSKKDCPIYCMRMRITHLHVRALKQVGGIKTSPTLEALGYSVANLVDHIEKQFTRGMGWHNKDKWHIDHIVPMSSAETVDDVIALNQLSNLRPMWAADNIRKKDNRTHLI